MPRRHLNLCKLFLESIGNAPSTEYQNSTINQFFGTPAFHVKGSKLLSSNGSMNLSTPQNALVPCLKHQKRRGNPTKERSGH